MSAADTLSALTRILESQERRRATDLQTSLAMMQFAQTQRIQKTAQAEKQLKMLQLANTQMLSSQAQSFLSATGWGGYYDKEKDDWAEDLKDVLVDENEGYGFKETDANRIVASVNAAYAGSPEGLLDIADELYGFLLPDEKGKRKKLSESERAFVKGFDVIGIVDYQKDKGIVTVDESWMESLDDISRTLQNKRDILQEMYEYGRGEFDIQREIGLTEDVKLPTFALPDPKDPKDPKESLVDLSEIIGEHESTDTLKNIKQNINRLADEISLRKGESLTTQYEINKFENSMRQLDLLESTGAKLTEEQQSLLIAENREESLSKLESKAKIAKDELAILSDELHKQELARNKIRPELTSIRGFFGMPITTKQEEEFKTERRKGLTEKYGVPFPNR